MDSSNLIIEFLKIVVSWPVATIIIILLLKNEISGGLVNLFQRLKSAEIGGQKLEFIDELESQSKITEIINNIQEENPELIEKSLKRVGIKEEDYNEYRSKIKRKIKDVQNNLQILGYDLGKSGIDGYSGPDTKKAIRQFQKDNNLPKDGVIGPQTIGMINKLISRDNRKQT